jgi:hypothetical protein
LSARISVDDPKGGGKALRGAAQAASTDPIVQFLWSTIGSGEYSGCDAASPCPEQAMAWARVEPDNGLAWLPPLSELSKSGDERAIDEAISEMAHAKVYDDHFVDTWLAFRKAIAARPMPASMVASALHGANMGIRDPIGEANSIMAMAYAAAVPQAVQALTHACRPQSHPQADPARFENCARIGRNMVKSDSSVLTKHMGFAVVRSSGQQNDTDRELRRVLDWRQQAAVEAMNRPHGGEGYFDDLAATGSESRAQELLLARAGIALDPPKDWKGRGE